MYLPNLLTSGASQGCLANNLKTKFCGARFNTFTDATENAAICGKYLKIKIYFHRIFFTIIPNYWDFRLYGTVYSWDTYSRYN